jgi:uncharacterized protein YdbL (DUF1318 family)
MLKTADPQYSKETKSSTAPLTSQQSLVIMARVQGATVTEATQQANIDRTTYYLWLKNPNFEAELNRAKKDLTDARRAKLQDLAETATSTLKELLTGTDVPANIRLKAAITVLGSLGTLEREPGGEIDPERIKMAHLLDAPLGDFHS